MNFYKHHIGDYAQATAHLSFVEDAAYVRLIRKYYAEEKPLPPDIKTVQRLAGARSKEEKQAVADVLEEFFVLLEDGWHNKRCDAEIAKAKAQGEANRQIAVEREARRKARAASNETGTKEARKEHETCNESSASREPSQTPDSRLQTPDSRLKASPCPTLPARAREGAFPILADWEPSATFWPMAKHVGITESTPDYGPALADFLGFWRDRPGESRTQAGWEKAFLENWKRFRSHASAPPSRSQKPRALSPHSDFEQRDYSAGINPDGSF